MSDKVSEQRDPLHRAGFDHPCRQTCSGWKQGFDRGFDVAADKIADLKTELQAANRKVEEHKNVLCAARNHAEQREKQILELNNENSKLKVLLVEAVEALKGFYECTMCKTRTETKWGRSCSVIDGVCLWRKVDHTGLIAKLQEVTK